MRLVDLDKLIPQLADKAKEMKDIADQCKGDAINYYNGVKYGLTKATIFVNNFPTVPIINPVTYGEWTEKEVIGIDPKGMLWQEQSARCSVCKRYLTTPYMYYFNHYEYCPHCGAKMNRSEE